MNRSAGRAARMNGVSRLAFRESCWLDEDSQNSDIARGRGRGRSVPKPEADPEFIPD
jgi:hypothetical protein